jgi:hypothetical protein
MLRAECLHLRGIEMTVQGADDRYSPGKSSFNYCLILWVLDYRGKWFVRDFLSDFGEVPTV